MSHKLLSSSQQRIFNIHRWRSSWKLRDHWKLVLTSVFVRKIQSYILQSGCLLDCCVIPFFFLSSNQSIDIRLLISEVMHRYAVWHWSTDVRERAQSNRVNIIFNVKLFKQYAKYTHTHTRKEIHGERVEIISRKKSERRRRRKTQRRTSFWF